jgi:2'-5' RNA ligase
MLSSKMPAKKYFIAIIIPEPLFDQIEALKQELYAEHGLKGALRSPAHITLHRPFEWKEEKEQDLIDKLGGFTFQDSFTVALKDFAFFEPRVIYVDVLKNKTIDELQQKLKVFAQKELRLLNEVNDLRGFHPHVTVAFRDLKKPKFYELQTVFHEKKIEGGFNFNCFSLLKLEKKWTEIKSFSVGKD